VVGAGLSPALDAGTFGLGVETAFLRAFGGLCRAAGLWGDQGLADQFAEAFQAGFLVLELGTLFGAGDDEVAVFGDSPWGTTAEAGDDPGVHGDVGEGDAEFDLGAALVDVLAAWAGGAGCLIEDAIGGDEDAGGEFDAVGRGRWL